MNFCLAAFKSYSFLRVDLQVKPQSSENSFVMLWVESKNNKLISMLEFQLMFYEQKY